MLKVLDHGFVRLVDHMGNDLSIVRSARVSHNAEWREQESKNDIKLIHYLMKNHHSTPFESVVLTFEVKAPIFVIRQWHRHRTMSYNEVSARYTELPEEFYVPKVDHIGKQTKKNKQARDIQATPQGAGDNQRIINQACKEAFQHYKDLLKYGTPRELARSVLPIATYTRMFATVNLHNLFHFLGLRLHEHAQWEIRQYAQVLLKLITPIVPVAVEAFQLELKRND